MNANMKYAFIVLLVIALLIGSYFYIKAPGHDHSMHSADQMVNSKVHEKIVACPVMGTKMTMDKVYDKVDYKGKTYYFCCGACKPAFLKEPEKYIK